VDILQVFVMSASFHEQDPGIDIVGESGSQDTACRAASANDAVVLVHIQ
jgi:hypothetical protein